MRTGFCWKPEWKRPLGRLRRRWKNNDITDLTESGWLCELIWLRIGTSSINCGKLLDELKKE
jgi:hypothetical protein